MIAIIFAVAAGVTATSESVQIGPPLCSDGNAATVNGCPPFREPTWSVGKCDFDSDGITRCTVILPHCDPGWSLVYVGSQPWCAWELRAPKDDSK